MIARLNGKIVEKDTLIAIVDVAGVGYEVNIPLSTYYRLPEPGGEVTLFISTFVREDSIDLYGFFTIDEKNLFRLLTSVSGVGPKLARNIISGLPSADLLGAIASGDVEKLKGISGVGKKTADRVIVELKDKAKDMAITSKNVPHAVIFTDELLNDVVSALKNLGYKAQGAEEAVRTVLKELPGGAPFEQILKEALKMLSR
ncbi:MAG: Holliday junction branch migration protein RuvA [Deltaproteobacteria bacterium]|nr:Holliday junction branch migration protein RuvA [Deltaproteobacteria bacterium]